MTGTYPYAHDDRPTAGSFDHDLEFSPATTPPSGTLGGAGFGKYWIDTSQTLPTLRMAMVTRATAGVYHANEWLTLGTIDVANNRFHFDPNHVDLGGGSSLNVAGPITAQGPIASQGTNASLQFTDQNTAGLTYMFYGRDGLARLWDSNIGDILQFNQNGNGIAYPHLSGGSHAFAFTWDGSREHMMVDGTDQGNIVTSSNYTAIVGGAFLPLTGGTLTGNLTVSGGHNVNAPQILASEGGVGNSGFSFLGDGALDTGMFSAGDGILNFYNNAQQTLYIDTGSIQAYKNFWSRFTTYIGASGTLWFNDAGNGFLQYGGNILSGNNSYFNSRDTGGTPQSLIGLSSGNNTQIFSPNRINYSAARDGHYFNTNISLPFNCFYYVADSNNNPYAICGLLNNTIYFNYGAGLNTGIGGSAPGAGPGQVTIYSAVFNVFSQSYYHNAMYLDYNTFLNGKGSNGQDHALIGCVDIGDGNGSSIVIGFGEIFCQLNVNCNVHGNFYGSVNGGQYCGLAAFPWAGVESYNFYTASDERRKADIEDLPSCLDLVRTIKPRQYRLNPPRGSKPHKLDDNPHWGFVAQQVAKAMREGGYRFGGHKVGDDEAQSESLNYNELVACLWKAVQELADRLDGRT